MSAFDPTKLSVSFFPPANAYEPIVGRKYTLTHSDTTGALFLSIGYVFDVAAINLSIRDEVIAQWMNKGKQLVLFGRVYISGGEFDEEIASKRFYIFQKELVLALRSIVYGDKQLYTYFPNLLNAPIYIYFESIYPKFSRIVYYGITKQYLPSSSSAQS